MLNKYTGVPRGTPLTKQGLEPPTNSPTQEPNFYQEPPWLWFTLPELGFPLFLDQYRRPLHPEIEEYMRKYVSKGQEWEETDDEDYYTEPTSHMKAKIESILYTWGEEQPETVQYEAAKQTPEYERFLVPHASRDPRILIDMNLENEDIFELTSGTPLRKAQSVSLKNLNSGTR